MSLEVAQIGSEFLKRFQVMKGVFKANLEKPERERKRMLRSFARIVFYMEKHSTREPGFEFIPLYLAISQAKV